MAPWQPPCAFLHSAPQSAMMLRAAQANASLLEYLYPPPGSRHDVTTSWRLATSGCHLEVAGCWCFHVPGSMVKRRNPRGLERCVPKWRVENCSAASSRFSRLARRECSCLAPRAAGGECLFSDMRPAKLLAVIAAARAARVGHIIEQGRYGGLSAYMYARHGFRVTSVELVPLDDVTRALRRAAPEVALLDADGRAAVIDAVARAPRGERLAVVFDGEKRMAAYETFRHVRGRVALAVFDDTNLDQGHFPRFLHQQGERAWHSWDCSFAERFSDKAQLAEFEQVLKKAGADLLAARPTATAEELQENGMIDAEGRLVFHGGMEDLGRFHLSIVRGDDWPNSGDGNDWSNQMPSSVGMNGSPLQNNPKLKLLKERAARLQGQGSKRASEYKFTRSSIESS
ncbi:hypothetical protein AB1Y20_004682 [Prymnesium parvum]|uniref:Uncharacterized protein n=1 Tax=Prymnesium parvum TaxID=97485 RepID=A0AB34IYU8_PRYPA